MRLHDFDYDLPKELIAQFPIKTRDNSRLMVLNRKSGKIEHTYFNLLPAYLQKGDLLVANDTRVIPARLYGRKETGGWVELFMLNFMENGEKGTKIWECLIKSRKKINKPSTIYFNTDDLRGEILENMENGKYVVRMTYNGDFEEVLKRTGRTPLPPYIKRARDSSDERIDIERYQTVFAKNNGAVAAPTAGFHFTHPLMEDIKKMGANFSFLTLHIGYGTFQPIREDNYEQHKIHKEFFSVPMETAEQINKTRFEKRRIVSVGTTTTRALETITNDRGKSLNCDGFTDLYIYPGYSFKSINALVTNFHLPRSSLLLLVSAFAGKDFIMRAYQEAVDRKYRFFSYGDAMLIV